jgi:hypothetical protein
MTGHELACHGSDLLARDIGTDADEVRAVDDSEVGFGSRRGGEQRVGENCGENDDHESAGKTGHRVSLGMGLTMTAGIRSVVIITVQAASEFRRSGESRAHGLWLYESCG